jgi:hypothetical protein
MSACLVEPIHIAAVVGSVTFYSRGRLDRSLMGEVAAWLAQENVASVAHRYQQTPGELVLPLPTAAQLEESYPQPLALAALLRALEYLEYQSCEHPGFRRSRAAQWLEQGRTITLAALPGYEEAPWGLTSDNIEAARAPLRERVLAAPPAPKATARALVALDFLQQLGGGREGAAAVLVELFALDAALVAQAARRR